MSPTVVTVIVAVAAVGIALAATWYAWRDYHHHPDRYGYRPGERHRQFTTPERGVTREPVQRWSSSSSTYTHSASTRSPRLRAP